MTIISEPTLSEVWDKAIQDLKSEGVGNPNSEQFIQAQMVAREALRYEVDVDKSTMKFKE